MGKRHYSRKRRGHSKKRGGATEDEFLAQPQAGPQVQAPQVQDMQAQEAPATAEVPAMQAAPAPAEASAMQAPSSCPPCPPCSAEEGFFSKFSPKNLNDKLVETQNKAIENTKNSIKTAVDTKKAELADAVSDFLKPKEQAAGRRSRTRRSRTRRKRSRTKRTSKKRISKKRSSKKRSSKKRSSTKRR
jgi:hypothetical protein